MHRLMFFSTFILLLVAFNLPTYVEAAATTKPPVVTKPPVKPKNPVVTIAKAKIMGNPLTEQEWLNLVFGQLSPRFAEFASGVLSEQIEPLIQKVLKTSHLPNVKFRFEKTDFGTVPPTITNVTTHKNPEGQEAKSITIDFDFSYLGDCDLQVSLMGIHSGVRDVQLSGRGRVVLKPTTKSLPLVGGFQVCFLERPNINFDLDGIADVCDWPILRRKFRREIRDDTAKKCVYPNRLIIPMSGSVDPMQIKCFEPTGLVAVKILNASGLPRKKGIRSMVGQDKPDPYVKLRIGAQAFRTRVIKNKANPVWPEDEPWYYFMLETPKGHRLRMEVFDEDSLSHDEFLGYAMVNVEDFLGLEEPQTTTMPLLDDPMENNPKKPVIVSGDLTFSMKWMQLHSAANASELAGSPVVIVTIFVYSCNNLVEMAQGGGFITDGDAPTTQLQITLGSQVKTGEVKKNNLHPAFEECYTFMLRQTDNWQEQVATIQVLEVENGGNFGSYSLPLLELSTNSTIQRRVVSISPDKPHITITLSANVKMATL